MSIMQEIRELINENIEIPDDLLLSVFELSGANLMGIFL
jgi:hypothetical protein